MTGTVLPPHRPSILLVDDHFEEVKPLLVGLEDRFPVLTERRADRAVERLQQHPDISAVLLDLRFDGQPTQGEDALDEILSRYPHVPIIVLTSVTDVALALRLVHRERRAHYYFTKDQVDVDQLTKAVENAIGYWRLSLDKVRMTDRGPIIGSSDAIAEALRLVVRAADTRGVVLVTGEPGTGKELFARAIHLTGSRRHQPFIPVNCGALPSELVASELFGTAKGAFSDARDRKGFFELAHGGTLFLDEIAELPLANQSALLRAVECGEVQRVGGPTVSLDVRLIAASNRDLREATDAGRFREDLYYRLMGLRIRLPSLRERADDIPELVQYFMAADHPGRSLTPRALQLLQGYAFPGNIRELRGLLNQAAMESEAECLDVGVFDPLLRGADLPPENVAADWAERLMRGQASWRDLKNEFRASSGTLRAILECVIMRWRRERGDRPSGQELATLLGTNRNHVNQVLDQVGLRLRDFD